MSKIMYMGDEYSGGIVPTSLRELLWTNPSPTSSYAQGNPVSADVASEFDIIEISFMLWTGYQYICATDRAYKGERVITTAVASSNSYAVGSRPDPFARAWEFSETNGVIINGGVEANFAINGAYAQASHVLIPYKIYGIKSPALQFETNIHSKTVNKSVSLPAGKSSVIIDTGLPSTATIMSISIAQMPNPNWVYAGINNWSNGTVVIAYNNTYSGAISGNFQLLIIYKE